MQMKNTLKKLFIPAFASRPVSALANHVFGHRIPIFVVHRIAVKGQPNTGITPDHLRCCLGYLKKAGYTFVSLEELILSLKNQTALPEKSVVFTMDDGFTDQALAAAPIFLEFNCPLTFFVISGLLDRALWPWDAKVSWIIDNSKQSLLKIHFEDELLEIELGNANKRQQARQKVRDIIKEMDAERIHDILSRMAQDANVSLPETAPASYQPLEWELARELEAKGIRFAPHSQTHRILSKLRRSSAEKEILGSWEAVKRELANPLKVFCYPTGRILDFGPREIGILKEAGFLGAVTTIPGVAEPGIHPAEQIFRLPRFELPDNMTDFIQQCSWIAHIRWLG